MWKYIMIKTKYASVYAISTDRYSYAALEDSMIMTSL
jgi:hypothetical protein